MARTRTLSHKGFRKRANLIQDNDPDLAVLCENVAFVSGNYDAVQAATRIFNGWRNSSGHNQCMVRNEANTAGIGIQKSGNTWWATFIAADDATP